MGRFFWENVKVDSLVNSSSHDWVTLVWNATFDDNLKVVHQSLKRNKKAAIYTFVAVNFDEVTISSLLRPCWLKMKNQAIAIFSTLLVILTLVSESDCFTVPLPPGKRGIEQKVWKVPLTESTLKICLSKSSSGKFFNIRVKKIFLSTKFDVRLWGESWNVPSRLYDACGTGARGA